MKKIILSVINDVVTDQRIQRIANTLSKNGFNVWVISRKYKHHLYFSPNNYGVTQLKMFFRKGPLSYFFFNLRLFFILLFTKTDILVANDLDTLPANYFASKLKGCTLIYDSHEYFTEIPELVNRKYKQKAWLFIERILLPQIKTSYTVSNSIATEYNHKYGISMQVIRNVPLRDIHIEKPEKPIAFSNKKILIYQGALNKGRGIELLIESMEHIENAILLIIGNGYHENEIKKWGQKESLKNKIFFTGKLIPSQVKYYTSKSSLGFSLEEDLGLNYRYALPNKLFDYIQAEIPVLVSDLPEMKNIVEQYKIGEVLTIRTPKEVANKIAYILNNSNTYSSGLEVAAKELCWEKEQTKLIEIYMNAVN